MWRIPAAPHPAVPGAPARRAPKRPPLVALALVGLAAVSQRGGADPAAPAPVPAAVETAADARAALPPPFDPAVPALPPHFEARGFPQLFRSLVVPPKGEFETGEQHAARRPVPPPTVHAFTVDEDPPDYDADAGLFRWRFTTHGNLQGRILTLDTTHGDLDSYVGSNAFGVTAKVIRSEHHRWGVLLPHQAHQFVRLDVPVAPERAAALKERLRLLAVVRLRPDSAVEVSDPVRQHTDVDRTSPTLDHRYDTTIYRHDLRADLLALWVYDHESGEVLGRFDLSGHRLNTDGNLAPQELAPVEHVWTIRDRVRRGMTMDEVERLAAPEQPRVARLPGKRREWTYQSWLVVELVDGKVVAVRTTPQGLDVTVAP
jgi:hypothetical protein